MAHSGRRFRRLAVCTCASVVLVLPALTVGAQDSSSSPAAPSAPPDFRFERPRFAFGVRGNWIFASAGSDIYDFVTRYLTLERSSFNTPAIGAEATWYINSRVDVSLGIERSRHEMGSEYRDQVEQLPDGTTVPILQTTALRHTNFYVSGKFALLPRGRRISRFAWIPSSFVPYVGGGAGISEYTFAQDGDFVNAANDHIFTASYRSNGTTPSFHVFGGTDIHLYKGLFLSLEGRYLWAEAPLSREFVRFEPIDLGGFRFGAGLHIAFTRP